MGRGGGGRPKKEVMTECQALSMAILALDEYADKTPWASRSGCEFIEAIEVIKRLRDRVREINGGG